MRTKLHILILLSSVFWSWHLTGQSVIPLPVESLCKLQTKVPAGEHQSVRVEGVYLSGLEGQYIVTSGCSGRSTSIEFDLATHRLWNKLVKLSNRTQTSDGAVLVIFDGEFYGPQLPDPKLPAAIRKNYHPGWDHMNVAMTKMIVRAIVSAKILPPGHPCASPKSDPYKWPCLQKPASANSQSDVTTNN